MIRGDSTGREERERERENRLQAKIVAEFAFTKAFGGLALGITG